MVDFIRDLLLFYPPVFLLVWMIGANFVFFYPIFMSVIWMVGASIFYWRYIWLFCRENSWYRSWICSSAWIDRCILRFRKLSFYIDCVKR